MNGQLNSARDYFDRFLQHIIDGLPKFLGALVVLLLFYVVAKALAGLVKKLLQKTNLNDHLHSGKGGNILQRAVPNPSGLIAGFIYWAVFLFGISVAISVLGVPFLGSLVQSVYGYIPNIIAALLIFIIAGVVSGAVATLATNTMGDTPTGKVIAAAGPTIVMSLAVFMILNQLKIAPAIVTITYAAIVGSAALGMALAFGMGGKDTAAKMLENLYTTSQRNKDRIANDMRSGAHNMKQKTNEKLGSAS